MSELNRRGWRVATHAVGDAAIDQVLAGYEAANAGGSIGDRRWIIEGLSVFLSVFDLPDVAATFCPPKPAREQAGSPADPPTPPCSPAAVARRLPPLDQVIDEGKVLALNMPAGIDRGWGNRPGRTRHPPCTGGEAPQGKRQGVPLRSGTRSGTTPDT